MITDTPNNQYYCITHHVTCRYSTTSSSSSIMISSFSFGVDWLCSSNEWPDPATEIVSRRRGGGETMTTAHHKITAHYQSPSLASCSLVVTPTYVAKRLADRIELHSSAHILLGRLGFHWSRIKSLVLALVLDVFAFLLFLPALPRVLVLGECVGGWLGRRLCRIFH